MFIFSLYLYLCMDNVCMNVCMVVEMKTAIQLHCIS